jgi:hypothetical protein
VTAVRQVARIWSRRRDRDLEPPSTITAAMIPKISR